MMCSPAVTPEQLEETSSLVRQLQRFGGEDAKLRKLIRSNVYTVVDQSHREHYITSWKTADYAYLNSRCPLPTQARGLFTEEIESDKYRIVARGYNKVQLELSILSQTRLLNSFVVSFSTWAKCRGPKSVAFVGLAPRPIPPLIFWFPLQWSNIPDHSVGPYTLTVKSNGCIIFIGALTPTDLVLTSKHAIGTVEGLEVSHAQKGEEWLEKTLKTAGKSKERLAAHLWERGWTAVAEVRRLGLTRACNTSRSMSGQALR
jgi:tRNA ligase